MVRYKKSIILATFLGAGLLQPVTTELVCDVKVGDAVGAVHRAHLHRLVLRLRRADEPASVQDGLEAAQVHSFLSLVEEETTHVAAALH